MSGCYAQNHITITTSLTVTDVNVRIFSFSPIRIAPLPLAPGNRSKAPEHTQSFASLIFTVPGGRIVTGRKGTPRCKKTWSHLSFPQKLADSPCELVAIIHGAPNAPCFITAFVVSITRFLFLALTVPSIICVRVCSGKTVERASTRPSGVEVSMPSLQ